mmetsp:Transcript_10556/g.29115  ORF Transcript_10556/g.29115 Transcript_10556/m.29115 type:complete len:231 (-) Transcript_10556:161-853(-)
MCKMESSTLLNGELLELAKDLGGMSGDVALDIGEDPSEVSAWVDDVGLTVRERSEPWNAQGRTVRLADQATLVGQHVEIQLLFRAELSVLLDGIDRHADDLCVELAVFIEIALEATCLQGASRREGTGVEVQHSPLVVLGQGLQRRESVAAAVGQFEGGRLGTGRWQLGQRGCAARGHDGAGGSGPGEEGASAGGSQRIRAEHGEGAEQGDEDLFGEHLGVAGNDWIFMM